MKKVYIWNDLPLLYNTINNNIEKKLFNIRDDINNESNCKLEIIKYDILKSFKKEMSKKSNIVTIGSRPSKIIDKKNYNIFSKRLIDANGFAYDCEIIPDSNIYSLSTINIVEDIIVSGTTIKKSMDKLRKNNPSQKINIYFLMGYRNAIENIQLISNVSCYCKNVFEEKSKEDSTCIFLSDLLFEKLGNISYLEHIKKINLFENKTNYFLEKIIEMKDLIK